MHMADNGGIGLKLKNIQSIINAGFALRMWGVVVDWAALMRSIEYRKLSPTARNKLENQKMDNEMKAYWSKAVAYVEDGSAAHPGELIQQPFVHARIKKFHEVELGACMCTCLYACVCVI